MTAQTTPQAMDTYTVSAEKAGNAPASKQLSVVC